MCANEQHKHRICALLFCLFFQISIGSPLSENKNRSHLFTAASNNSSNRRTVRESAEENEKQQRIAAASSANIVVGPSTAASGKNGVVASSVSPPADPCLLKCKDGYMLNAGNSNSNAAPSWRVDNAIGSPLHALIETVSTDNSLDRIASECNNQGDFIKCLHQCGSSAARQILIDGQQAMSTVCESFKKDKEFLHFVLPCLAKNGQRIGKHCQLHWSMMENDVYEAIQSRLILGGQYADAREVGEGNEEEMEEDGFLRLCRAMSSYSDCHLRAVGQLCHRRSIPFFVRLNSMSSAALIKMLLAWFGRGAVDDSWLECKNWDPAKLMVANGSGHWTPAWTLTHLMALFISTILFTPTPF